MPSENILGPDGRIIASKRGFKEIYENPTESAYQFYHYDMQASVGSIVLGEEGAAGYRYTERNQYDPFGKQNESTSFSEVENNIKYGGSMSDSSGLYYMGARHYDPNVGRFLQQDSYKGDRYSPWTQNLYTYTSNNPVNYIDPTGHAMQCSCPLCQADMQDEGYYRELRALGASSTEATSTIINARNSSGGYYRIDQITYKGTSISGLGATSRVERARSTAKETLDEIKSTGVGASDKLGSEVERQQAYELVIDLEWDRLGTYVDDNAAARASMNSLGALRDFFGFEFGMVIGNFNDQAKLGALHWSTDDPLRISLGTIEKSGKDFLGQKGFINISYIHAHPLDGLQGVSPVDKGGIADLNDKYWNNKFVGGNFYTVIGTQPGNPILHKMEITNTVIIDGRRNYSSY